MKDNAKEFLQQLDAAMEKLGQEGDYTLAYNLDCPPVSHVNYFLKKAGIDISTFAEALEKVKPTEESVKDKVKAHDPNIRLAGLLMYGCFYTRVELVEALELL